MTGPGRGVRVDVPQTENEQQQRSAALDLGLVGFLGGEAAGEAAAQHVAPGALLGFGECVDAVQCVGSAGCTDVLGHRGRHTSGLYGYQAQGWSAPSVQTGEQP